MPYQLAYILILWYHHLNVREKLLSCLNPQPSYYHLCQCNNVTAPLGRPSLRSRVIARGSVMIVYRDMWKHCKKIWNNMQQKRQLLALLLKGNARIGGQKPLRSFFISIFLDVNLFIQTMGNCLLPKELHIIRETLKLQVCRMLGSPTQPAHSVSCSFVFLPSWGQYSERLLHVTLTKFRYKIKPPFIIKTIF